MMRQADVMLAGPMRSRRHRGAALAGSPRFRNYRLLSALRRAATAAVIPLV